MTNECRRRTVSMSRVARSMSHKFGAHPSSSILHPSSYILHPLSLLVLILAGLGPGSQTAESEDDLEGLEQRAFQAAVERVAPSVVRVETVGGLERAGKVQLGTGPTTGLVIDPEGYVVSSTVGLLNQPESILVQLPDGSHKPAKLVATDHSRMVVLLKIETDE